VDHEAHDVITGRLETIQGEVPVHRVLQFRLGNAAGDAHHAAKADRTADPNHARINRGFRRLAMMVALLTLLERRGVSPQNQSLLLSSTELA